MPHGRRSRRGERPPAPWREDGRPPTAAELRAYGRGRLIDSRLTPNTISMTGLALNVLAAVLVTQRLFFLAGLAFIIGSLMDTLDGRYSRMSGKGTMFGAFLDSTLDRMEEGLVLAAVAAYFASQGDEAAVAAVVLAVLFSLMVSYTRARAEALGVECKVGIATRPVRVVVLSIGPRLRQGRRPRRLRAARRVRVRACRARAVHHRPAHLARAPGLGRKRDPGSVTAHRCAGTKPLPRQTIDPRYPTRRLPDERDQRREERLGKRTAAAARRGARGHRRRGELRVLVRAGRGVLQGRRRRRTSSRA